MTLLAAEGSSGTPVLTCSYIYIKLFVMFKIRLDNREVNRKDWMFKLVGQESFSFGPKEKPHQGTIQIDAVGGFSYQYSLIINGKPYKTFLEHQSKAID